MNIKTIFTALLLSALSLYAGSNPDKPHVQDYNLIDLLENNDQFLLPASDEPASCEQKQVKNQTDSDGGGSATSGYHALKNGLLIARSIFDKTNSDQELQNGEIIKNLFINEQGRWRATVIKNRAMHIAHEHINEQLANNLKKDKVDSSDIITRTNVMAFVNALLEASKVLSEGYFTQDSINSALHYKIEKQAIIETLFVTLKSYNIKNISKETVSDYFDLDTIEFSVLNDNQVKSKDSSSKKYTWNSHLIDATVKEQLGSGTWLGHDELEQLTQQEKTQADSLFKHYDIPVFYLEKTKAQFAHNKVLNSVLRCIRSKPFSCVAVFILYDNYQWVTCVAYKQKNKRAHYILADSLNRNMQENKKVQELIAILEGKESITNDQTKSPGLTDKDQQEQTSEDSEKQDTTLYRSPLASIATEDLPKLEQIFNNKMPDKIRLVIDVLKEQQSDSQPHMPSELKNCLLLYGPPGTGKTTIAELIARETGREVLYAHGGSFITPYQGSGHQSIEALFKKAKSINKPVVIIIDEIDAAAQSIQNLHYTQEENRTLKALIATFDKYLHDPSIFVICTTNHIKKLEGAILSRLSTIKVDLSDFEARKKAILYYLQKNNIAVISKNKPENTVGGFFVYDDFVNKLAYSAKNFSGRDLKEVVNDALQFAQRSYKPQHESYSYSFGHYNMCTGFLSRLLSSSPKETRSNAHALLLQKHLYSKYKDKSKELATDEKSKKKNIAYALSIGTGALGGFFSGSRLAEHLYRIIDPNGYADPNKTRNVSIGGALLGTVAGGVFGGLTKWATSES